MEQKEKRNSRSYKVTDAVYEAAKETASKYNTTLAQAIERYVTLYSKAKSPIKKLTHSNNNTNK